MAKTLGQLASSLNKTAAALPDRANVVAREVAYRVHRFVVQGTPVDEGWARSNWQVSLDAPLVSFITPYARGKGLGISETGNAAGAIASGLAVIARKAPGQVLFVVNNTPYIQQLNRGSSRQSPAQFVQIAVINAIQALSGSSIRFYVP